MISLSPSPILFQANRKTTGKKTDAPGTGTAQAEAVYVRQGVGRIHLEPNLKDVSVAYTPQTKERVLQELQQFQPENLTDLTSQKVLRFTLPASVDTQTAWQKLDEMVSTGKTPYVSPGFRSDNYPKQTLLLTNLISVTFKKRPSETKLNTVIQQNNLKLVKVNEYDPEYRFEVAARPWRQTVAMLNALHETTGVKSADANYIRFVPKPGD